jgi:ubiquinone/menaquinone biosynthesis C-methylase UbiE
LIRLTSVSAAGGPCERRSTERVATVRDAGQPMSEADKAFTDSIAEIYDTHLVPLIFEQYAADLARRTAALGPDSLVEIAAGSGVVTRAVAPVLGRDVRYVVTDLNPPMLDRAAAVQPDASAIEWRPADALALPFDDETFDLALCQFGAMFFPDRVRAYSEARRVLRPGGSFVFSMWDRIEENEFAAVVTDALAVRYPQDPPRFLPRTPHGHHDTQVFQRELEQAGFANVAVEAMDAVSSAATPDIPAVAYCMGTPLRNEIEALDPDGLEHATIQATQALSERYGEDRIEGRIRAFVITAS